MRLLCAALFVTVLSSGLVQAESINGVDQLPELQKVETPLLAVDIESLRGTLVNGLRATRDDQKGFINHILELVEENRIPVSMVYASFRWARKRRPDYPYPFFEYAIKALAKRKRIVI